MFILIMKFSLQLDLVLGITVFSPPTHINIKVHTPFLVYYKTVCTDGQLLNIWLENKCHGAIYFQSAINTNTLGL